MKANGRFATPASALVLAMMLAGCGGGGSGVNSTPTPTPGAGGGTPPPSTPTPTAVNTDLIAPLVSESFANDAISGTANYSTSGASGTNSAAGATLTVSYSASTGTYTIVAPARTQSFAPADLDAALSNTEVDVFVRTSGNTSDSLVLTRAGIGGKLNYRYVGSGFWQRTVTGASTISGSIEAFTYGVRTPGTAVPHSGQGSYTTDMLGVIAYPDNLTSFSGSGVLAVDFAGGNIAMNGTYAIIDSSTGLPIIAQAYTGSASLSSSSNLFTGTLDIFPLANRLTGRFYGPGAEELGAVFFGTNGTTTIEGTLLGRAAGSTGANDGLLSLSGDTQFDQFIGFQHTPNLANTGHRFELDASGQPTAGSSHVTSFNQMLVNFGTGRYQFLDSNSLLSEFAAASRVAGESTASYNVYRKTSGGTTEVLKISRPGPTNPTIALTYTAFGGWTNMVPAATAGHTIRTDSFFAFGMLTNPSILPKSGSGNYAGVLLGSGISQTGGNNRYDVTGDFTLTASFDTARVSGSMTPILTDTKTATILNFAAMPISGTIYAPSSRFDASYDAPNTSPAFNTFSGNFFGPTASEVGATFRGNVVNPNNISEMVRIEGVAAGK